MMKILAQAFLALGCLGLPMQAAAQEIPDFEDVTPPPAPDYTLASSWAALGESPGAAGVVPRGAMPAALAAEVDVFFIHPTTLRAPDQWNQDVGDEMTNAWTDMSIMARQASVFSACCRIFAPRYRQASFVDKNGGRDHSLELAYQDVAAAFDYFLEHYSQGRPFIIAGHSQGAFLTSELLARKITGTPLLDRLVAAYPVGMSISYSEVELRYPDVAICATPEQTGCLLQWNAILSDADIAAASNLARQYNLSRYPELENPQPICVNPVSFIAEGGRLAASQTLGSVPGKPGEGPVLPIEAGKVAAGCDKGLLPVEVDESLNMAALPGGSMHYHDYGLFYEDIRRNAVVRVQAYLASQEVQGEE